MPGPLLEVEMLKKWMALWRENTFRSEHAKNTTCPRLWMFKASLLLVQSKGFCTEQRKWVKRVGFAAFAKPDGRHGMFEEDLTR